MLFGYTTCSSHLDKYETIDHRNKGTDIINCPALPFHTLADAGAA